MRMSKKFDILKNFNVLYLEDDENLLRHTSDILEDFVGELYSVKTTIEAMNIILEKNIDVIISDIQLENDIVKPINIQELLLTLHDILLPKVQEKELRKNQNIIKTIGAISDGKQVEIVKYIFNNLDEKNQFFASYSEIMEQFSISKPTLIKLFKDLADKNILTKTAHKTYIFNESSLETI